MEIKTIKQLFEIENIHFKIPDYQRAYSWQEHNWGQFLEDLKECNNHFYLGQFIFEKKDNAYFVIDGQQRITTLIIFLSVAINILKAQDTENSDYSNKLFNTYLKNSKQNIQKFETVSYDNNFFKEIIIDYQECRKKIFDTKSKEALQESKKYFKKELKSYSLEQIKAFIELLENASISTYVVEDRLIATQIFAYQNDRGLALSNLEILKAYLLSQLQKLSPNLYEAKLNEAFEQIYHKIASIKENEDTVLNAYWKASGPQGFDSEDPVTEIKAWIKNSSSDEKRIEKINNFVQELVEAFNYVYDFEKDNTPYCINLRRLNNLALSYPLIFKARLNEIDNKTYARLIKFLENITFRNKLRGGRAKITTRLQELLDACTDTQSLNDKIDETKLALRYEHESKVINDNWWYWSDEEIFYIIEHENMYENLACNYLLWRYEQYLCEKKDLPFTLAAKKYQGQESIEHIAPQTECEIKPNGYGAYNNEGNPLKGIESGGWIHAIGNLMLIDKDLNSALGNKIFAEKLDRYLHDKTKLLQNKEIKRFTNYEKEDYPRWLLSSIRERHYAILEAAQEIWDLDKI